ncbi:hypothetical protein CAEBREN_15224 [Caenorhabditis brenneri]|uniref:F-box associated domain-containing protein n=1 Tax=Caenorhabditis brenneri TaxID=135651 RepID=G0MD12_CAEBE|nr:hypothetical protein CAEBREN_15224 [Caenorhabditis brenneri]
MSYSRPLHHDNWGTLVEYMEANRRSTLNHQLSHLLEYTRSIPLKIQLFHLKCHEFTLNDHRYLFRMDPLHPETTFDFKTVAMWIMGPTACSVRYRNGYTVPETMEHMLKQLTGGIREIRTIKFAVFTQPTVMPKWLKMKVRVLYINCEYKDFNEAAGHVVSNDPEKEPLEKFGFQVFEDKDPVFGFPLVRTAKSLHITCYYVGMSTVLSLNSLRNLKIHVNLFSYQMSSFQFMMIIENWIENYRTPGASFAVTKFLSPGLKSLIKNRYPAKEGKMEEWHNK